MSIPPKDVPDSDRYCLRSRRSAASEARCPGFLFATGEVVITQM